MAIKRPTKKNDFQEDFINAAEPEAQNDLTSSDNIKSATFRINIDNLELLKELSHITGIPQGKIINDALDELLKSTKYQELVETAKQLLKLKKNKIAKK